MDDMRGVYLLICLQLLLGFPILQVQVFADSNTVLNDFKIVAKYKPGYSDWKPWKVTITGDGNVIQETYVFDDKDEKTTLKSYSLSRDDLKEIITEIKESNFMSLSKKFDYKVTDNPTLILTVTIERKTHQVIVYAPSHSKQNNEVKRFLDVWNKVLKKVPPPNPEQKQID